MNLNDVWQASCGNNNTAGIRLEVFSGWFVFVLVGVRISAFASLDDKKPLQKSIVGFLQSGKADCSSSSQGMLQKLGNEHLSDAYSFHTSPLMCPLVEQKHQRQEDLPWRSKQRQTEGSQATVGLQQSFFQRAHVRRLQLEAANAATKNEGSGENAPVIANTRTPATASENNHLPPDLSENPSPVQAHASTSACEESETLTCPVCFRKVETTDLNVFNTHIDQCLSNASQKTNNGTESDTESESGLKKDREERAAVNKLRRRHEAQEKKSKVNPQKGQSSVKKDSVQKVSLIKDDNKTATLQEPQPSNSKGPVFVCPVCQLTQETHDLAVFNHHVDLCLNQEVLHELGRQTSSSINPSPVKNSKSTGKCVY